MTGEGERGRSRGSNEVSDLCAELAVSTCIVVTVVEQYQNGDVEARPRFIAEGWSDKEKMQGERERWRGRVREGR